MSEQHSPFVLVCEPCGSTRFEPTPYRDVFGYGVNLVRCAGCGAKFYDRMMQTSEEHYHSAAADEYARKNAAGDPSEANPEKARIIGEHRRKVYVAMVERLRHHAGGKLDRLYEVGANSGEFLAVAKAAGVGWLRGCDPIRVAPELAARYEVDVECAFFCGATKPAAPMDAVVMLDVIEHTDTPRADLERAYSIVCDGGVLLLKTFYDEWHQGRVPPSALVRDTLLTMGLGTSGYFAPTSHRFHFDEPVLLALIARCGWCVVETQRNEVHGQITVYGRRS